MSDLAAYNVFVCVFPVQGDMWTGIASHTHNFNT